MPFVFERSSEAQRISAANYKLTSEAKSRTDYSSCIFILSLLEKLDPKTIVEIGVASGTSTLLMLKYLGDMERDARVWSFDLAEKYADDPTRNIAYLVTDNFAVPPSNWSLHTKATAADVASIMAKETGTLKRADFVYIDAHHGHPWPTLDCLVCLGFCKPGTWIALHDINLPRIMPEHQSWGAVYLYEGWTGEKCQDIGDLPFAGAIKLSEDIERDIDNLFSILNKKWDVKVWPAHADKILLATKLFLNPEQHHRLAQALGR